MLALGRAGGAGLGRARGADALAPAPHRRALRADDADRARRVDPGRDRRRPGGDGGRDGRRRGCSQSREAAS